MIIVQNAHTVKKPLHFSESHRFGVDAPKMVLEVVKFVLSTDHNGVNFFFIENTRIYEKLKY